MPTYTCLQKQVFSLDGYKIIPVRDEDKYDIMNWRNSQIDILRQDKILTKEDQDLYFNKVINSLFSQKQPSQLIFSFLHNDVLIGYGGLVYINWHDNRAEVSFLIDSNRANNATLYQKDFTAYLNLIKQLTFTELNFNRIYTETFDIRNHHIKILEQADFRLEGRMKQHIFINEKYCDSLVHGFLKEYYHV